MYKIWIAVGSVLALGFLLYFLWFNRFAGITHYELDYKGTVIAEISVEYPYAVMPEFSFDPFEVYDVRWVKVRKVHAVKSFTDIESEGEPYVVELKHFLKDKQGMSSFAGFLDSGYWMCGRHYLDITIESAPGASSWRMGDSAPWEGKLRRVDD